MTKQELKQLLEKMEGFDDEIEIYAYSQYSAGFKYPITELAYRVDDDGNGYLIANVDEDVPND